jgi:hypothetical protein
VTSQQGLALPEAACRITHERLERVVAEEGVVALMMLESVEVRSLELEVVVPAD